MRHSRAGETIFISTPPARAGVHNLIRKIIALCMRNPIYVEVRTVLFKLESNQTFILKQIRRKCIRLYMA
jgi:hypothetical protein